MNTALSAKWNAHYRRVAPAEPLPSEVLAENAHLLARSGTALDLACGAGGNALFLARRGFAVTARDISSVAVERLRARAAPEGLLLHAETADVEKLPWPSDSYDVITVSRFLNRSLVSAILAALNPGGLLFYQTYTRAKQSSSGPGNPDYLLGDNELLTLFGELAVRYYREDTRCGDPSLGRRDEAYFVGQKPRSLVSGGTAP